MSALDWILVLLVLGLMVLAGRTAFRRGGSCGCGGNRRYSGSCHGCGSCPACRERREG